jgi:ATP-dependent helicase HrpA
VKFLRRQLALPAELAPALRPFGGAKSFENALTDAVIRQIFEADIRSAAAFASHTRENAPRLFETARECMAAVIPLLEALFETRSELSRLAAADTATAPVFQVMDAGLDRLVPANFLELYETARFGDIERYVRAVGIRAARAQVDFEKDRAKAAAVAPLSERFQAQLDALHADSSEEKRAALEAFFWMLEEFKVSVFAQELKTAFPVSAKRLTKRLEEIERMV